MIHKLPELPYSYDALEPYIDARTMEIHHSKHHAGYVGKLNVILEKYPELTKYSLEDLLRNLESIPEEVRTGIRNNGGGHYNHSLFWRVMGPNSGGQPDGELYEALVNKFGSFDEFKKKFSNAAATQFASGWAWLAVTRFGDLVVYSTPNQDNPIMTGLIPILGLDVWEHAYYLKYQNRRTEYIENWWNVVNWEEVAKNYREAIDSLK